MTGKETKMVIRTDKRQKEDAQVLDELYVVKFMALKSDGYWEAREDKYFGSNKCCHQEVQEQWQKDHYGDNVRFISVTFQ